MDDKKKLIIIVAIGIILMSAILLPRMLKKTAGRAPVSAKTGQAAEMIAPLFREAKKSLDVATDTAGQDDANQRDPFALPEVTQVTASDASELALTGITTGAKGKLMAIINGNLVYTGSKVGKFTVVSISADKVVVTDGAANFQLKMKK